MSEKQDAVAAWLVKQGKRENLSIEELPEVHSLFAPHKGFGILWSLIAYDRARDLEELKNIRPSTEDNRARLSELQGQIRAVDRLHELLLDIADPSDGAQLTAGIEGQER